MLLAQAWEARRAAAGRLSVKSQAAPQQVAPTSKHPSPTSTSSGLGRAHGSPSHASPAPAVSLVRRFSSTLSRNSNVFK